MSLSPLNQASAITALIASAILGLSSCDQRVELTFSLNPSTTPTSTHTGSPKQEASQIAPNASVSTVAVPSSTYYAGQAAGGQSIRVDLDSVSTAGYLSVDFVYYLENERIQSQVNCEAGTWTTFPEKAVHTPASQATQNMLNRVCSNKVPTSSAQSRTAIVFDPPSNVRTTPNGPSLCSVRERTTINIYGSTGSWYYTDVCGTTGVIDLSQLQF